MQETRRLGLTPADCAAILEGGQGYSASEAQQLKTNCFKAITLTSSQGVYRWGDAFPEAVASAKRQGLTPNDCAKIADGDWPTDPAARLRLVKLRADRLAREAATAAPGEKNAAEARARQAAIEVERLRKLSTIAEAAEARRREQELRYAKERAERLAREAAAAQAREKEAAEARARQAAIEVQRLRKLRAEAEAAEARRRSGQAEAEARRKKAEAEAAEAEARRVAALERQRATEAEAAAQQRRLAEAARQRRLAELTVGLRPISTFMDVATASAVIRRLPERQAADVRTIQRGDQVHVVAVLPSGWVQVAEEGEPVGWLHRAALRPVAGGVVAAASPGRPPTAAGGASLLYATQYPFPVGRPNPEAVAVLVGIRHYRHADVPEVDYAHNDVEAMRQYVAKTLGFSERNIIILRDSTKAELEATFGNSGNHRGRLFNAVRAGRSDVFVYYSGHGVPGGEGNGYLFPSNGDPGAAELTGYDMRTLLANLGKIPARSLMVALDTCFSGLSQGGAITQAASPIYIRAKMPAGPRNGIVLTAADGQQIASWDRGAELGLFTRYLLEGLLGLADRQGGNGDGAVQLAELQTYLQSEVAYQARRLYGRNQTPQVLGAGDRVVAPVTAADFPGFGEARAYGAGARPTTAPAVRQAPEAAQSVSPSNPLRALFGSPQQTDSRDDQEREEVGQ
ncbi:MAG: caspase family protein [Alphaproteobacteria bacterium]|nr:caspase family protein [Alphaproteobacteria bacterium]